MTGVTSASHFDDGNAPYIFEGRFGCQKQVFFVAPPMFSDNYELFVILPRTAVVLCFGPILMQKIIKMLTNAMEKCEKFAKTKVSTSEAGVSVSLEALTVRGILWYCISVQL